jgi:hypothetical protein
VACSIIVLLFKERVSRKTDNFRSLYCFIYFTTFNPMKIISDDP